MRRQYAGAIVAFFGVSLFGSYGMQDNRMHPDPNKPPIESCKGCGLPMDLAEVLPLSVVECPRCSMNLTVFERFGPFKLESLLGTGGMGAVYEATDLTLKRRLALKVLQKNWSHDAELTAQFEREAALTARVNHPHVVRVYSTGNAHGMFYIAMELVDQGSLDTLMEEEGRVSEAEVLRIGVHVAEGLQAAYRAGLIHRDIKPGNILFGEAKQSKIVDFGLALQFNQHHAPSGELWGTPYYIAPEALDFKPEDLRSDMYALGATLWHALVGAPPYDCSSHSTHELLHARKLPVDLAATRQNTHPLTASLLNKTLAFAPADRHEDYESLVSEFRQALAAVEGAAARSPEAPAQNSLGKTLGRSLLALGLLAGIAAFAWKETRKPPTVADPVETLHLSDEKRLANATRLLSQPDQLDLGLRRLDLIASSPSLTPILQLWTQLGLVSAYALRGEAPEQATAIQAALTAAKGVDEEWLESCLRFSTALGLDTPHISPGPDPRPEREAFRQFCLAQSAITKGQLPEAKTALERACRPITNGDTSMAELLRLAPAALKQLEQIHSFERNFRTASNQEERTAQLKKSDDLLSSMQPSWPLRNVAIELITRLKAEPPPPAPPPATVQMTPPKRTEPPPPSATQPVPKAKPAPPQTSPAFAGLRAKAILSVQNFQFAQALKDAQAFEPVSPVDEAAKGRFLQQILALNALFRWAISEINHGGTLPSPLLHNKSAFRSDPVSADDQRLVVQTSSGGPQLPIAWNDVSLLYLVKLVQFRIERQPAHPQRTELLWGAGLVHLMLDAPQNARPFLEEAAKTTPSYAQQLPLLLPEGEATP